MENEVAALGLGIIGGIAIVAVIVRFCFDAYVQRAGGLDLVKGRPGKNDNEKAISNLIELLQNAERSIIMYDDGSKASADVYDDAGLISAAKARMDQQSQLRIRCFFNYEGELAFVEELSRRYKGRFEAKVRRSKRRPRGDKHFKIADGGTIGYISDHKLDDRDRDYVQWDCRSVGQLERIAVFGIHLLRFWWWWISPASRPTESP